MDLKRISHMILYVTVIYVPAEMYCPKHTFIVNFEVVTWPASPISNSWIPSDCLDEGKRLIFRQCLDDGWSPNNTEIETICTEKMDPNYSICPNGFTTVPKQSPTARPICYRIDHISDKDDDTFCLRENVSFMELSSDEQSLLISTLAESIDALAEYYDIEPTELTLFVQNGRSRWPKPYRPTSSYDIGDIELQNTRCGQFGLPLKLNSNTLADKCREEGECDSMCTSLSVSNEPFSVNLTITECSEWALTIYTNPFLQTSWCADGYYREGYEFFSTCYSIQMFPDPIAIEDVEEENIVETFCQDSWIMELSGQYDMFIFQQLSEKLRLTDGNNCLFGVWSSDIVKYSDWDSIPGYWIDLDIINWDKSMNYSRITNESYLTVKPNGQWTWATDAVSCILCRHGDRTVGPTIFELEYKFLDRRLELMVSDLSTWHRDKDSDRGFICFALISEVYKTNLTIFPIDNLIGNYLVQNIGMGQYWCSGHNSAAAAKFYISTVMHAYGIVFAFEVARICTSDCFFTPSDLDKFIEVFKQNFDLVLLIKESASVEDEPAEIGREYNFTVHLSLTLQEKTAITLGTNLVDLTGYQIETVFIYEQLNKLLFDDANSSVNSSTYAKQLVKPTRIPKILDAEMSIQSIKSTEYCLHQSVVSIDSIIWRMAYLHETISPSLLCPSNNNNSEVTRTCVGDSLRGLYWEELVDASHCYTFVSQSLLELYIYISTYPNETIDVVENVKRILETNIQILLPIDVFLTSRILQIVSSMALSDLSNIFSIYNSLQQISDNFLKISALFNSTNILLDSLDTILLTHIDSYIIGSSNYTKYGNASYDSALLKTFVLNPRTSGVSGFALYRPRNCSISLRETVYMLFSVSFNL